jgi:hypothetical protein
MTTTQTTDLTALVDTHLAAYCEPDPAKRATLVAEVWSAHGRLVDPPFDGAGHDGIAAMADTVLTHYAGHRFERTTPVDEHHGHARYGWALVAPDGTPAVTGTDFVELAPDGTIRCIIGFFGDLGPLAEG